MYFENNCFQDYLQLAEISPIYKNNGIDKENHRPASTLSPVSRVIERILYNEIDTFMKKTLTSIDWFSKKKHTALLDVHV